MRYQLKEKEKAVLEATLDLVNNRGFHDASMAKIAKLAGISVGTIYLYFENKQDMLDRLYLFIKAEMCASAFWDHDPEGEVEEEFRKIWYHIAEYKLNHWREAMYLANCDISPIVQEEAKRKAINFLEPFLNLCRRGQEEGILRRESLYFIYAFSINPLSYLVSIKAEGKVKLTKKQIDESYRMVWNAVRVDDRK